MCAGDEGGPFKLRHINANYGEKKNKVLVHPRMLNNFIQLITITIYK